MQLVFVFCRQQCPLLPAIVEIPVDFQFGGLNPLKSLGPGRGFVIQQGGHPPKGPPSIPQLFPSEVVLLGCQRAVGGGE